MQGNASIIRPIPLSWATTARVSEDRSYATETATAVVRQAVAQRSENRSAMGTPARASNGSGGGGASGAPSATAAATATVTSSTDDDLISAIQRALISAGIEPQTVSSDALINWLATRIAGSIGKAAEAPASPNHAPVLETGALLDRVL